MHPPCLPLAAGTTPWPPYCSPDMDASRNVNAQSTGFDAVSGHASRARVRPPRVMPRGYRAAPIPLGTGRASRTTPSPTYTGTTPFRQPTRERLSVRGEAQHAAIAPCAQRRSSRAGRPARDRL